MPTSSPYRTISVIGLGYIGLPTAAAIASRRVRVIGVDINPKVVETINSGNIHIVEPELDMLVHATVSEKYLRATATPEPADAFLIAVPTPFKGDNHEPDMRYVRAAAEAIAPVLASGNLVILESTSPVGATEQMAEWLAAARPDLRFPQQVGEAANIHIAYCPERVLPGRVMHELVTNDRILGGITPACAEAAAALYRIFVQGKLVVTSARTAEMCKLAENAYRDVNIAFANDLSLLCDQQNVDVRELIQLANHHPRVNILHPGCGVGGHCIAVDPWFLIHSAPDKARLMHTARQVNDNKPHWVLGKVREVLQQRRNGARVAVLGLAFKPDIDDLRESPALAIAEQLIAEDIELLVVEPYIDALPDSLGAATHLPLGNALATADIVLALVNHSEFAGLATKLRPGQILIDVVGIA